MIINSEQSWFEHVNERCAFRVPVTMPPPLLPSRLVSCTVDLSMIIIYRHLHCVQLGENLGEFRPQQSNCFFLLSDSLYNTYSFITSGGWAGVPRADHWQQIGSRLAAIALYAKRAAPSLSA